MVTKSLKNKKRNRNKTKSKKDKNGYNLLTNGLVNIKNDTQIKDNYYKTVIDDYTIYYFTPTNFILFKTTDQLITPIFNNLFIKTSTEYKIKIGDLFVNTIIKIKTEWYVITRFLENAIKGNIASSGFLNIKKIFKNNKEKLFINIRNCTITTTNNETIINISDKNVSEVNDDMFKILTQFEIQQNTSEIGKDLAVNYAVYNAVDYASTGDKVSADTISDKVSVDTESDNIFKFFDDF